MKTETHKISVRNRAVITSIWMIPDQYESVFIIAPGAGKDMTSEFLCYMHENIAKHDVMTVKFNFPYLEQGRKAPNAPTILEDTWLAVIEEVQKQTGFPRDKIFLSGKSMGGRYATLLAAKFDGYAGIIHYGYPLHAPGKTEKPRGEDLSAVHSPMLFFQGTRDSLCELDILRPILEKLDPQPTLHIIEGGDHSFKLLKRLNRSYESVLQELVVKSVEWIKKLQ